MATLNTLIGSEAALPLAMRIITGSSEELSEAGTVHHQQDAFRTWEFDVLTEPMRGLQSQYQVMDTVLEALGKEIEVTIQLDDLTTLPDHSVAVSSITKDGAGVIGTHRAKNVPAAGVPLWAQVMTSNRKLLNRRYGDITRTNARYRLKNVVGGSAVIFTSTPTFLCTVQDAGNMETILGEQGLAQTRITLRAAPE